MSRVGLAHWMNAPDFPFWMTAEAHAQLASDREFRQTETGSAEVGLQLVGASQVGRGSLNGMQALHRLAAAGFHIWPFEGSGLPVVVEILPRVLTGACGSNSTTERERYLAGLGVTPEFRRLAASGEDAFDAAVSALVIAARACEPLA